MFASLIQCVKCSAIQRFTLVFKQAPTLEILIATKDLQRPAWVGDRPVAATPRTAEVFLRIQTSSLSNNFVFDLSDLIGVHPS